MWRRRQPPTLPVPPPEMRDLIGGSGPERFDNPTGEPVYDYLPAEAYEAVFDFGCGCGRVARQLIQQQPRPQRYLGVDLHAGMIEWCRRELAPRAPGFEFEHHDIYNAGLNPEGEHRRRSRRACAGSNWHLVMRPDAVATEVDLPADVAPLGHRPPPLTPAEAQRIGR